MKKPHSALIIAGHGSTENPDSSTPTFHLAEQIRRRDIFAEVACAFWKEEPSFRQVYHMLESKDVYIVPNFISEGYFTREVLPRELRLDAKTTTVNDKQIHYCDPVGTHPHMTDLLMKRAREVAPGIPPNETSLIIVGHGTALNPNSRKAIEDQVDRIRVHPDCAYAAVLESYMEETPLISDWVTLSNTPNVIVVPFFIADGLHSYQDIPVLLGIEEEPTAAASCRDVFRKNPIHLHGRQLYYSSAIGTDPALADVILDQVHDFDAARETSTA